MKKCIALGLTGVMMLSLLTGCGKKQSQYLLKINYDKYVKLCEYKGVEAQQVVFEVTDEDVDEEMTMQSYDFATYDDITDRAAIEGDYVAFDYEGYMNGELVDEYSGEEELMLGEGYFPEVEEALVGKNVKDSFETTAVLTEDWAEEGDVGKEITIKGNVTGISQENLPELTDAFVKENTDYDSLDAYKDAIREELTASKTEEYKSSAIAEVMDYMVQNSTFNGYPDELYKQCEEAFNAQNEQYAAMYGMELSDFMELMGMDEKAQKENIEENVKYELVIGAIAIKEGIDCTEEEIQAFVKENYQEYGYETEEAFLEDFPSKDIGYQLLYEKVVELLYEKSKKVEIDEKTYLEKIEAEEAIETENSEIEEIEDIEDGEDVEDIGTMNLDIDESESEE
ncbi:MAG: hypothetical protein Q4D51_04320 [Eubacteriales bacterium]|nr:hypothetical protein [Eubacteriales bacterium]